MKKFEQVISGIEEDSIAQELGLEPGDVLISINGKPVRDIFDYDYLCADDYLEVLVRPKDGGEECLLEIEKDYDEALGLIFEDGLIGDYISCTNKCIFCFIDQMPPGMRETLYFKDDDSRLSFLQGNYITLTNMKEADVDRIIEYRMEPINISVHTTNPELRVKMLGNRFAGEKLKFLDRLFEGGITMNGQIVLCRDVNDGAELERTIRDLSKYAPLMQSVSVVPAGMTRYRQGLYELKPFTKEDAEQVIDTVEAFQKEIFAKYDIHFIHASDEFYMLAGRELPEEERYDGYLQYENGVGMMRAFVNEAGAYLKEIEDGSCEIAASDDMLNRSVAVATGRLAYPYMNWAVKEYNKLYKEADIRVYEIKNEFFGESITVSGLITGGDIISQLKNERHFDELLIPVNMLRSGEQVFLDDITVSDIEEQLGTKVRIITQAGDSLINGFMGIFEDNYNRQNYEL